MSSMRSYKIIKEVSVALIIAILVFAGIKAISATITMVQEVKEMTLERDAKANSCYDRLDAEWLSVR